MEFQPVVAAPLVAIFLGIFLWVVIQWIKSILYYTKDVDLGARVRDGAASKEINRLDSEFGTLLAASDRMVALAEKVQSDVEDLKRRSEGSAVPDGPLANVERQLDRLTRLTAEGTTLATIVERIATGHPADLATALAFAAVDITRLTEEMFRTAAEGSAEEIETMTKTILDRVRVIHERATRVEEANPAPPNGPAGDLAAETREFVSLAAGLVDDFKKLRAATTYQPDPQSSTEKTVTPDPTPVPSPAPIPATAERFCYCCYEGCPKEATLWIQGRSTDPEDYTLACDDHAGPLMGDLRRPTAQEEGWPYRAWPLVGTAAGESARFKRGEPKRPEPSAVAREAPCDEERCQFGECEARAEFSLTGDPLLARRQEVLCCGAHLKEMIRTEPLASLNSDDPAYALTVWPISFKSSPRGYRTRIGGPLWTQEGEPDGCVELGDANETPVPLFTEEEIRNAIRAYAELYGAWNALTFTLRDARDGERLTSTRWGELELFLNRVVERTR